VARCEQQAGARNLQQAKLPLRTTSTSASPSIAETAEGPPHALPMRSLCNGLLERFPMGLNHPIDQKSLKIQ
jgi:hypothetical protein